MSFSNYFNKLNWLPIFNKGPLSAVVEGLSSVLDTAVSSIRWLRNQFNPGLCDEQHLDKFAFSRGIKKHVLETSDQYRARISKATDWHRKAGKAAGVPEILAYYGYNITDIINIRGNDPDRWAEFIISFVLLDGDDDFHVSDVSLLPDIINEIKPARSKATLRFNTQNDVNTLYSGLCMHSIVESESIIT